MYWESLKLDAFHKASLVPLELLFALDPMVGHFSLASLTLSWYVMQHVEEIPDIIDYAKKGLNSFSRKIFFLETGLG